MSPVHVIVGEDQRAEAMWANAFTGAVDLYRFPRNVDAFERLTAAEAGIDLVVLTPAQHGPFNLTADQFIARVLEGPLASSRHLAKLHVIVVGQHVSRSHPRVMAVSTLDAAIRLVKFGEIERAPRPMQAPVAAAPRPTAVPASGSRADVEALLGDAAFAGSVISRIWDAPDAPAAAPARSSARAAKQVAVVGGGPAAPAHAPAPLEQGPPQLFSRTTTAGFMAPRDGGAQQARPIAQPVLGGGGTAATAVVGAPGEAIEVATGALQAARPYVLPNGAGYRGPGVRAGNVHAAAHASGGQPVPPALASQVQSMVYGAQVGNPHDPLLTWSSASRGDAAPAPMPVPVAAPAAQHAMPMQPAAPMQQVRTVPMDPPAGVYAPAQPAAPADPFLARAEQGGGVSFG
jgi:hypothetical protein